MSAAPAMMPAQIGSYRREGKHTVYLWPDSKRDRPPLRLRLVRVGSAWLVTDVTDPRELPRSLASELYRRRWGIEVAFRSLKQILERRKVRSCTAAHARAELAWSVVGMWTLMLAGASALGEGVRAATAQRGRHTGRRAPRDAYADE